MEASRVEQSDISSALVSSEAIHFFTSSIGMSLFFLLVTTTRFGGRFFILRGSVREKATTKWSDQGMGRADVKAASRYFVKTTSSVP